MEDEGYDGNCDYELDEAIYEYEYVYEIDEDLYVKYFSPTWIANLIPPH